MYFHSEYVANSISILASASSNILSYVTYQAVYRSQA
jgi:hypothetical protein